MTLTYLVAKNNNMFVLTLYCSQAIKPLQTLYSTTQWCKVSAKPYMLKKYCLDIMSGQGEFWPDKWAKWPEIGQWPASDLCFHFMKNVLSSFLFVFFFINYIEF